MLESAIPHHLERERTVPAKGKGDFNPPYPSYSSRFPKQAKDLVMAIFGVQYASKSDNYGAALSKLSSFINSSSVAEASRPAFSEPAAVTDNRGFYNSTMIAYWPSKEKYDDWKVSSGFEKWWNEIRPDEQTHGWFLEVFLPTMDRIESVFTGQEELEGSAHMRESVSGQVREHAYWGSMRDRLPVSQTDEIVGEAAKLNFKDATQATSKSQGRVQIPGKRNLAVIRSGQDWSVTGPEERKLYLETMHPTLTDGMTFLRDHGDEIGCYNCRLMEVINPKTGKADLDRTFGLAYFDDLSSLEYWSREHETHLRIFKGFFKYVKSLNNNITLRLFHEVLVLEPHQQCFEYIGCHDGTGMLTSMKTAIENGSA